MEPEQRLRNTGTNDSFKLSSINVTAAVPEPATWAMMLVGCGSVGAAMRRRKSKVATNVSYALSCLKAEQWLCSGVVGVAARKCVLCTLDVNGPRTQVAA